MTGEHTAYRISRLTDEGRRAFENTHDYLKVDPLLGGDEAFDALLAACKERGLRVVLDGVFNHASRGFFQFNDVLENGAASPWIDWFTFEGVYPVNAYDHNKGRDDYVYAPMSDQYGGLSHLVGV